MTGTGDLGFKGERLDSTFAGMTRFEPLGNPREAIGDESMQNVTLLVFCLSIAVLAPLGVTFSGSTPHVVLVTGDHEYSGEATMPLLARELEKNYGMKATVLKAYPDQDS